MRRTKIVCTLGPALDDEQNLAALVSAGMDVARLNFSHGSHDDHRMRFNAVHRCAAQVGRPVAVLQDLCGPKIRVGSVADGTRLRRDARFVLTSEEVAGNEEIVHLPIEELIQATPVGNHLLLDDGLLELVVIDKTPTELITRVVTGGVLGSKKGISAPGVLLPIPAVTEKDEADVRFGLALGVDYVALSFVKDAHDVQHLRSIMEDAGRVVPIIVKIEKGDAVENLETIMEVADGAMVARGDLGVEMPIEEIPMVQKRIIRVCNRRGKPVITATQMLDSMIRNPRPTRAEVTDIANAVFDGTDALMLSGETAVGAYPTEAVQTMARVAMCAEREMDYAAILAEKRVQHGTANLTDAIAEAVASIAHDQKARAILCGTTSGATSLAISKFRPSVLVIAVTYKEESYRRMALYWGVCPLMLPMPSDTDSLVASTIQAAQDAGYVTNGDLVVVAAGTPVGISGKTNLIKAHTVGQSLVK